VARFETFPDRANVSANKGYIDVYKYHIGSGVIYVARAWPRKPTIKSTRYARTHLASSILLNAYRNYPIILKQPNLNAWKPFNETPLDWFRAFNQSFCYSCPTLPHIIFIQTKSIDHINDTVTFIIKTSSLDPWILKTQYLKTDIYPYFTKLVRGRFGTYRARKVTHLLPPNTINPIESLPPFFTFQVPFTSFNIPICNIPYAPAKFPPTSFPLTGFSLLSLL